MWHPLSVTGFQPLPRSGSAMCFIPGRNAFVFFGGNASSSGENFLDDTFLFDAESQSFRFVERDGLAPFAMDRHTGVEFQDKLWVFGGDRGWVLSNKLWVFDPALPSWSQIRTPNPPVPRRGHTAVRCLHRRSMIVFGGIIMLHHRSGQPPSTLVSINETYELPLEPPYQWIKHTSQGPVPPKRRGHVSVLLEPTAEWPVSRMYVFGGYCEQPAPRPDDRECGCWLNDLWQFIPESSEWNEISCWGEVPPPTVGHTAAVTPSGSFVVFGGGTKDNVLTNTLYECRENGFWRKLEPLGQAPPSRSYCCGAVMRDKWFIFGGCDNDGELSDIHAVDLNLAAARPRSLLNFVAEFVIQHGVPYHCGTPRSASPVELAVEEPAGANAVNWVVCFEGGTTMSLRDFEAVSGIAVRPQAVLQKQPLLRAVHTPPPSPGPAHAPSPFSSPSHLLPNGDIRIGLFSADPAEDKALFLTLNELAACSTPAP